MKHANYVQSDVSWNQRCLRTHVLKSTVYSVPVADPATTWRWAPPIPRFGCRQPWLCWMAPKPMNRKASLLAKTTESGFGESLGVIMKMLENEFALPVALDPQVMCLDYLWWSRSSRPVMRQLRNWFLRSSALKSRMYTQCASKFYT